MNSGNKELLTIEDLCEKLHVCRNIAYRLLATQKISGFKVGRSWRIPAERIEAFIVNQLKKEKEENQNVQSGWND